MPKTKIPERLYKYRGFSNRTLDALIADQLFFADPGTFNDPLDSKPILASDLDEDALADILARLVEQRVRAEMSAAAKTIKYRGPKNAQSYRVTQPAARRADDRGNPLQRDQS